MHKNLNTAICTLDRSYKYPTHQGKIIYFFSFKKSYVYKHFACVYGCAPHTYNDYKGQKRATCPRVAAGN